MAPTSKHRSGQLSQTLIGGRHAPTIWRGGGRPPNGMQAPNSRNELLAAQAMLNDRDHIGPDSLAERLP